MPKPKVSLYMIVGSWQNIEFTSRIIYVNNIESADIKEVMDMISKINYYDQLNIDNDKKYKPEPIKLMINTFGGEVYEAFALIDLINKSITPIHTYGIGSVMSSGLPILLAGKRRFAYKLCTFMYHEVATTYEGKTRGHTEEVSEMKRVMVIFDKLITSKSKLKQKQLDQIKTTKKDWYFTSKEAKALGIIEAIV